MRVCRSSPPIDAVASQEVFGIVGTVLRVAVRYKAVRVREDISKEWEKSLLQSVNVEVPIIYPCVYAARFQSTQLIPAQT